jgi:hypothetical protein
MQVPTPQADARELRSTRRAYRERRRAAPTTDPRVLAPACASQACTCGNGTWESWRLPNGSWNWYGMGIQWCSWWILWDFDLCSQLETTCDRPSCGTPQAQCDRESPAATSLTLCSPLRQPLSPSQLLWRREQYYFSILSVYTTLRNPPTPLERTPACANPAVLRVRTVLRVQPVSQLPLRWIASGLRLDCDDGFDGLR